jgi:hypothetical protein
MSATNETPDVDITSLLNNSVIETGVRLLFGSTRAAFDEGRASAMQGLSAAVCPYTKEFEPARLAAWHDGFLSFARERCL